MVLRVFGDLNKFVIYPLFLAQIFLLVSITHGVSNKEENGCLTPDSKPGVCINLRTHLKNCPPLYQLLKANKYQELRKSLCSTADGKRNKVCCSSVDFVPPVQLPEPDYAKHRNFHLFPPSCGQPFTSDRIIGGKTARPGDNPWMTRLALSDDEGTSYSMGCSGTIINKRYILSAAHCFKEPSFKLIFVRLGETDEDTDLECIEDGQKRKIACTEPQDVDVEEIIIHPGYSSKKVGSSDDIALIRIAENINTSSYFTRPICLPFVKAYNLKGNLEEPSNNNNNPLDAIVSGWGKTSNEENVGSSTLQFVKVPLLSISQCQNSYKGMHLTNKQICGGGEKGHDSCQGDSGGPLILAASPEKKTPRQFQIGVVSFGRAKCGQGDAPVVYTKTRSYLSWILDNVRP